MIPGSARVGAEHRPPARAWRPLVTDMRWIMVEYLCPDCGRFDSLEERPAPSQLVHSCRSTAQRVPSAVKSKTAYGWAATRGTNEEPPPNAYSTEALADGMSYSEWRKQRHGQRRDEVRRRMGVDPKVFV